MGSIPPAATRRAALEQLDQFVTLASAYASERNFVRPGHPHVSQLSPYVRHRLLLEEEVIAAVYANSPPHRVAKFVEEVLWRTYWKGWLELHPDVWTAYVDGVKQAKQTLDRDLHSRYLAAIEGTTGISCFDTWVRELKATGYLHNHVRMWFASIWMFTLRLPWTLGAAFFLRHLVDGDAASNTLSWRWVGGLHTKGKHYVARAANIERFTDGRCAPRATLNEAPEPLTEGTSFARRSLDPLPDGRAAIQPPLSESPAGFLHTPDDLAPEIGILAEAPFSAEALFSADDVDHEMDYAPGVKTFQRAALDDAAQRAATNWNGDVREVRDFGTLAQRPAGGLHAGDAAARIYRGHAPVWVDAVVAWATREHLRTVRCYRPPVGPWRDRLPTLREELSRVGVALHEYRRPWDSLHWPHSTGGFFRFKKNLPTRMEAFLNANQTELEIA